MSALRRASWPPKYEAINKAYIADGINPKTSRQCKLHKCPQCNKIMPKGSLVADHIEPVIPEDLQWTSDTTFLDVNWNDVIRRLYVEVDKLAPCCRDCHKIKSNEEQVQRRNARKQTT